MTRPRLNPYGSPARRGGWPLAGTGTPEMSEESPDSQKQRCRVTPGRGNPTDSATENRPPRHVGARVKRWGKSPPPGWQQAGHGKPHREQCQIGIARAARPGAAFAPADPGWQLEGCWQQHPKRNGHLGRGNPPKTESGLQALRARLHVHVIASLICVTDQRSRLSTGARDAELKTGGMLVLPAGAAYLGGVHAPLILRWERDIPPAREDHHPTARSIGFFIEPMHRRSARWGRTRRSPLKNSCRGFIPRACPRNEWILTLRRRLKC